MIDKKEFENAISRLIESVLIDLGLELLACQFSRSKRGHMIQITLDREDMMPVSVSDCERASRHVTRSIEEAGVITGSFTLDVSSPGFKRIIRIPKDLSRFVDHRMRFRLKEEYKGKKLWIGFLKSFGDAVVLNKTEIGEISLPLEMIEQANLDD